MKPKVIALLPNAGLANCLFVWARAALYADVHGLEFETLGWNRIHIGPLLRGERVKRYYRGYFKDQATVVREFSLRGALKNKSVVKNPRLDLEVSDARYIVFDALPHWSDYFEHLKHHRERVKQLFFENLNSSILEEAKSQEKPEVSMHVRMGDFRVLEDDEDFSKVGLVRTPLSYFSEVWSALKAKGYQKSMVFSDGHENELSDLLNHQGIQRAPLQKDILDLIQLSKSAVVVTSASSSFSLWASFLSEAIVVMHPDHIHKPIRVDSHLKEISAKDINTL